MEKLEKNLACLTADEILERADEKSLATARTLINSILDETVASLKKYQDTGGFIGCTEGSSTAKQRVAWVAVLCINEINRAVDDFVYNYR